MPWFPGAVRKEIPRFRTPMTPVRVNLHTAVSSTTSLYTYFAVPGRVCSHFYVREDGTVEQYVDTAYRAAADLDGNPDTISIETWDGYLRHWRDGDPVPTWTPAQVASLTKLLAWLLATHPSIPTRLASDSRSGPSSHGVSWHRLGCDPWRQPGALRYSKARGKVCPGDARIAQIPGLLAAAVTRPTAPASHPVSITSASERDDDTMIHYVFEASPTGGAPFHQYIFNPREWSHRYVSGADKAAYETVVKAAGDSLKMWRERPDAASGSDRLDAVHLLGNYIGPADKKPTAAKG